MGKMQRDKGKRWEREVAKMVSDACGVDAHRGWQARDGSDAPDVVSPLPIWLECKCGAQPNPRAALKQACEAAPSHLYPVAVIRDDRKEPFAIMKFSDLLEILALWWRECGASK